MQKLCKICKHDAKYAVVCTANFADDESLLLLCCTRSHELIPLFFLENQEKHFILSFKLCSLYSCKFKI